MLAGWTGTNAVLAGSRASRLHRDTFRQARSPFLRSTENAGNVVAPVRRRKLRHSNTLIKKEDDSPSDDAPPTVAPVILDSWEMVAEGNLLPGDSVIPPQEERIVLGETVPDADERTETTSTSTPVSEETRLEMETGAEFTKVTSKTADTQTQIKRVVEKSEQPEMASADTLTVEDPTALVGNDDNDSRSVSVTILLWATIFVALGVSAAILVKIFTICREESRSTYQDDDEDDGTTATKASSNTTRTDDNQDTTELSLLEDGADDALRILEIPTRHCADSC